MKELIDIKEALKDIAEFKYTKSLFISTAAMRALDRIEVLESELITTKAYCVYLEKSLNYKQ